MAERRYQRLIGTRTSRRFRARQARGYPRRMTTNSSESRVRGRRKGPARDRAERPSQVLRRLGGWSGGSIGQAEALAGINVQCTQERMALWQQFQHLAGEDPMVVVDAVMDHCAAVALDRVRRGEMSLLRGVRPLQSSQSSYRRASRTNVWKGPDHAT